MSETTNGQPTPDLDAVVARVRTVLYDAAPTASIDAYTYATVNCADLRALLAHLSRTEG